MFWERQAGAPNGHQYPASPFGFIRALSVAANRPQIRELPEQFCKLLLQTYNLV
jgi:hypothetical protein